MDRMLVPFDFHRLPPLLCLKTELLLNCPKLGKGTLGMAYKAILEDAATMVVKRLKDVGAGKEEFEQQMEIVGSIKHKNVVELRAYYYSKDEKLIVSDYFSEGSVAEMLHVYKISSESSGGK